MTEPNATGRTAGTSKIPPIPTHAEAAKNPHVLEAFNAAVVEEFRVRGGRVGGPFEDSNVLLLHMTGAKTGRQRITPLEYFKVDGRVIIVATRGGAEENPAWVHNLRAHPGARIEIREESYDVHAGEIHGDERDQLFARVVELCPRIKTYPSPDRVIPVFELQRA